jgi:hypothetical protein
VHTLTAHSGAAATPFFANCSVARTVDPKRKKVAESEKNLRLAQKELAKIKVSLSVCVCSLISRSLHIASLS